MRRVPVVMASALLLVGCAAPRPPVATTAAELGAPHRVVFGKASSVVKVDADTNVSVPRFIPLSPVGLLVGAAATAIVTGAQLPGAAIRGAKRDSLATALGNTEAVAAEFAATFNDGRAVVVMGLGTEADVWTWVSVPASAVVSERAT